MFPHFSISKSVISCEPCQLAKHCRSIYPVNKNNKTLVPFSIVHSDVWCPSPTTSLSGFKYFVTFVDDCSRVMWFYLLKNKSDVSIAFKSFYAMICTQFNTKLQVLRSDNGGEYLSRDLSSFFYESSIVHQTTCPGTPEQNGVAEQKNRHILEVVCAIIFTMNVPKTFWSEAIQTVVYLMNRMPSPVLSLKSLLEVLSSNTSLYHLPLKTFGYIYYAHVPKSDCSKLNLKALKDVFLGYGVDQKGYNYYHPPTRRKFVSRDVTFFESIPFFSSGKTSLQEEQFMSKELSPSVPLPVPVPIPIYHFDGSGDGGKGEKEL